MPKQSVSSAATAVAEPESTSKTPGTKAIYTKWDTFDKAGLGVSSIKCEVIPGHSADEACKTKLIPTAQNVIDHINAGHGGGFLFTVNNHGKLWPGWKQLAAAGVEIQFIRDEVNDHHIPLSVRSIKAAMLPHQGKFRGAWQSFKNQFLMNLAFNPPPAAGDDYTDDEPQSFE